MKGDSYLSIAFAESEHTETKHPKIFEQNKKADLEYKKDMQIALDKQIKNSKTPLFTQSKWDGQDMTDEQARKEGII